MSKSLLVSWKDCLPSMKPVWSGKMVCDNTYWRWRARIFWHDLKKFVWESSANKCKLNSHCLKRGCDWEKVYLKKWEHDQKWQYCGSCINVHFEVVYYPKERSLFENMYSVPGRKINDFLSENLSLHGSDKPSSKVMAFNDLAELVKEYGLVKDLSKPASCTKLKSPPIIMWCVSTLGIEVKSPENLFIFPVRGINAHQNNLGIT